METLITVVSEVRSGTRDYQQNEEVVTVKTALPLRQRGEDTSKDLILLLL